MNEINPPATSPPALEPLLDEPAAAEFLRTSAGTLGNWRRAKPPAGPAFVVINRAVRYAPADLRAFVASNRRAPSPTEAT